MSPSREVLVIERAPELTAFFERVVGALDANVRLTVEPDAGRAERLVATGDFDDVIHDEQGMLALIDRLVRAQRATAAVQRATALDNRW